MLAGQEIRVIIMYRTEIRQIKPDLEEVDHVGMKHGRIQSTRVSSKMKYNQKMEE